MEKISVISDCSPAIDIDSGYRDRVADAIGIEASDLTSSGQDNPKIAMLRMIAAYILSQHKLSVGDVARIMGGETETWTLYATEYIERRLNNYFAFRIFVERSIAAYDLASIGLGTGKATATGIDVNGYRDRIADAAVITPIELVAVNPSGQDAELVQKVAACVLLSQGQLSLNEVVVIMDKPELWVTTSKEYVERHARRNRELKAYVETTTAAYEIAGIGNRKSLAIAKR